MELYCQLLTLGLSLIIYFGYVEGNIIGDRCRYDSECFVEQSYCLKQEICDCKENFVASEDLHFCIATIGAICNSRHDCSTLPNSNCYEEFCLCEHGYVPDPHNVACKPVSSGLRGMCEYDTQCQSVMGDFATCARGHCECLPNFHYHGKCVRSRGLGDSCKNSTECYSKDYYRNVTECVAGHCRCKQGYHQTSDGHCRSKGVSHSSMEFLIFITAILSIGKFYLNHQYN